jgi:hypothetical protein
MNFWAPVTLWLRLRNFRAKFLRRLQFRFSWVLSNNRVEESAMARTLAERLRAHEQSKARLAEAEAKLKLDERKQRTRRLVEAGALVEKTGLLELETNALYGALLSLRGGADDAKQIEQWAALGGRAFAREARARDEGKEPVLLIFTTALAKDVTTVLRKAGFRYSRVMQHWEGLARFDEAESLAQSHGGTARRVSGPADPAEATQKEAAE